MGIVIHSTDFPVDSLFQGFLLTVASRKARLKTTHAEILELDIGRFKNKYHSGSKTYSDKDRQLLKSL